MRLEIGRIRTDRQSHPSDDLTELVKSVKEHGIFSPLEVRALRGEYELVDGLRRLLAARTIGLTDVPVRLADEAPERRTLQIKVLRPEARVPTRAYRSAGYDLFPCEEGSIAPGCRAKIPLGFASALPEDHVAVIDDRGSVGFAGVTHLAGVIDEDFRGEWMVIMHNLGAEHFRYGPHKAVAQALVLEVPALVTEVVNELPESGRGAKMLGSSDKIGALATDEVLALGVLRAPSDWCEYFKVKVWDSDGWRASHRFGKLGTLEECDWATPITALEFACRWSVSTAQGESPELLEMVRGVQK